MERKNNSLAGLKVELSETIARQVQIEGDFPTAVPGLHLYRRHTPLISACQMYEPAFAVLAQGAKAIDIGSELIHFGEGSWLLTPLHVPAMSRIIKASRQKPYLACAVLLDMHIARELIADVEADSSSGSSGPPPKGLAVTTGPMTADLLDPLLAVSPQCVADAIAFAIGQRANVGVHEIVVRPTVQTT